MKTDFLKGLGIDKQETIDAIMAENGKDVKVARDDAAGWKTKFEEVETKLKAFDGVNVADLQSKITTLTNDMATQKADYESKLADGAFERVLSDIVSKSGARNATAVSALLDVKALKASRNQEADIKAAVQSLQKENAWLFEQARQFSGPTPGPGLPPVGTMQKENPNAAANAALRGIMKGE